MNKIPALLLATTLAVTAPAAAQETPSETTSVSWRTEAPNTDKCPQSLVPPEPVDTSEALAPGQPTPTPLPATPGGNCGFNLPEGFRVDPNVVAGAWIVTDLDSGEIIASKDPHGRYRPASIIKALIALVAIEELDLKQRVTVTEADANIEGSAVGIGPGGVYTVEQLLQGLVMASGNDAAHALATALGGDQVTLDKVNKLARRLGTTDTVVASYTGLDAPGMSTSAYDMALIYSHAFADPTFARLVGTEKVDFPGYGDTPGYELWNDNGLFMNDPDGIGGKTGYTDDAHHTFVGALDRGGRRLMAVVLNTTVEHGPRAWQQAQMLLDAAYASRSGIGQLTPLGLADAPTSATRATTTTAAARTTSAMPTATRPASQTALDKPWVGWLIVGLVALLVIVITAFSLLLPRRSGRGSRAGRFRN